MGRRATGTAEGQYLLAGVAVTFWHIASGLIYLILIPLAVSLFVRARYAEVAEHHRPYFTQASTFSLLALMVLMVVLNFNNVIGMLGTGGLLASLILVVLTVTGGYFLGTLGGPKWVQALGAGQRNIAAAMVVATIHFSNDVVVTVIVYSQIGLLVMTPVALKLGKQHAKAAGDDVAAGAVEASA